MTTAQPPADLVPAVLDLVSDIRAERDRLLDNLRDLSLIHISEPTRPY